MRIRPASIRAMRIACWPTGTTPCPSAASTTASHSRTASSAPTNSSYPRSPVKPARDTTTSTAAIAAFPTPECRHPRTSCGTAGAALQHVAAVDVEARPRHDARLACDLCLPYPEVRQRPRLRRQRREDPPGTRALDRQPGQGHGFVDDLRFVAEGEIGEVGEVGASGGEQELVGPEP